MTITEQYKIYTPATYTETLEAMRGDLPALDGFGDSTDDARWFAGDTARKRIDDDKLPYNHVCAIIGKRMGYAAISVKNFLACSRFYFENGKLLSYKMSLRYSVMAHATKHPNPKDVLNHAQKYNSSIEEIRELFPISERPEPEPVKLSIFGVAYKALKRRGYELVGETKKAKFEALLDEFVKKFQALLDE